MADLAFLFGWAACFLAARVELAEVGLRVTFACVGLRLGFSEAACSSAAPALQSVVLNQVVRNVLASGLPKEPVAKRGLYEPLRLFWVLVG